MASIKATSSMVQQPPDYIKQSWRREHVDPHDLYLLQQTFVIAPDGAIPSSTIRQRIRHVYEERIRSMNIIHYDPWEKKRPHKKEDKRLKTSCHFTRQHTTLHTKPILATMYEPYRHHRQSTDIDWEIIHEGGRSRRTIQPRIEREGDTNAKPQINTAMEYFDALFARSNASPPSSPHPRSYSSCSPSTVPFQIIPDASASHHARSQPHLTSSYFPHSVKSDERRRQSSNASLSSNTTTAQMKRKTYSLTHAAQVFLQSSNAQCEQLEPLARSCSYKRPQSIKKYRQQRREKEKEREQKEDLPSRKYSTHNNNILNTVASSCARKSTSSGGTSRISAVDLMASDDPHDQWTNPKGNRSGRVGSLPLDQLQLPPEGDEEFYRVRQFHTTSKGFVNRGDSFKRSFKRSSGSISRRSSVRKVDHTPSQEHLNDDMRMSTNSLLNSNFSPSGPNLNGILDSNYVDSTIENISSTGRIDEDDNPHERVRSIHLYQIYLVGMSGTGKCSLLRQFKTTEYRGIYEYSSSVEDDPDNTVSIMLDGIESRFHIINIDVDLIKCSVEGDAYIVVYSITDRQSFQTAIQLIKNIREKESAENEGSTKRRVPIMLVGNKSDLVRKRAVTKETAHHAAFRYDCKFVETSAAINDKVDDLLAGTLKQIRLNEQQRRRLTIANGAIDVEPVRQSSSRKGSTIYNPNSKNFFSKFLNVFRRKPSRLPADVENLNIGIR